MSHSVSHPLVGQQQQQQQQGEPPCLQLFKLWHTLLLSDTSRTVPSASAGERLRVTWRPRVLIKAFPSWCPLAFFDSSSSKYQLFCQHPDIDARQQHLNRLIVDTAAQIVAHCAGRRHASSCCWMQMQPAFKAPLLWLNKYKLRRKLSLADVSRQYSVWAAFEGDLKAGGAGECACAELQV